jgi:plasmid stabilization system protein ParE
MPQIILSAKAIRDLQRFRNYLLQFNEDAAQKAAVAIIETTNLLLTAPNLGKPLEDMPEYRQLITKFGAGIFTICYRLDFDRIIIVTIKHSKEKSLCIG